MLRHLDISFRQIPLGNMMDLPKRTAAHTFTSPTSIRYIDEYHKGQEDCMQYSGHWEEEVLTEVTGWWQDNDNGPLKIVNLWPPSPCSSIQRQDVVKPLHP